MRLGIKRSDMGPVFLTTSYFVSFHLFFFFLYILYIYIFFFRINNYNLIRHNLASILQKYHFNFTGDCRWVIIINIINNNKSSRKKIQGSASVVCWVVGFSNPLFQVNLLRFCFRNQVWTTGPRFSAPHPFQIYHNLLFQ